MPGTLAVDAPIKLDARTQLLADLAAGPARRGYAIAYNVLGNRGEAEDAVQEALAIACERVTELRDPAAAAGWYLRIVTSTCLRVLRRRRLKRAVFGRFARPQNDLPIDDEVVMRSHPAPEPSADGILTNLESQHELAKALDGLPSKQRIAVLLRYGQGLAITEIAELLSVEVSTAKTHLVRGLARLRDQLPKELIR